MTQTVRATLIGLNRYSASLGLALREHSQQPKSRLNFVVTGFDDDEDKIQQAQQIGAIDTSASRMGPSVKDADFVLISQPPDNLGFTYEVIGDLLKPGAVVLDMSFHKVDVNALAKKYLLEQDDVKQAYLINVHPVVQSTYLLDQRQDVTAASADQFKDSDMIIAPDVRCPEQAVKLAADLADILGMNPRFVDTDEYRSLVDFTENLPVLLGTLLFGAMQRSSSARDLERCINPNFALMTQGLRFLNAQDVQQLWQQNRQMTVHHIDSLVKMLTHFRAALMADDDTDLSALTEEITNAYADWEVRRENGNWESLNAPSTSELRSNFLSGLFGFGGRSKMDDAKDTNR